jgi:hypothetical protein
VVATFESGQQIAYAGALPAHGADFEGDVAVTAAGRNAANFEPVGTRGLVGGRTDVRSISEVEVVIGGRSGIRTP